MKFAICISSSSTHSCGSRHVVSIVNKPPGRVFVDLRTHVTSSPRNGEKLAPSERTRAQCSVSKFGRMSLSNFCVRSCIGARQVTANVSYVWLAAAAVRRTLLLSPNHSKIILTISRIHGPCTSAAYVRAPVVGVNKGCNYANERDPCSKMSVI